MGCRSKSTKSSLNNLVSKAQRRKSVHVTTVPFQIVRRSQVMDPPDGAKIHDKWVKNAIARIPESGCRGIEPTHTHRMLSNEDCM